MTTIEPATLIFWAICGILGWWLAMNHFDLFRRGNLGDWLMVVIGIIVGPLGLVMVAWFIYWDRPHAS